MGDTIPTHVTPAVEQTVSFDQLFDEPMRSLRVDKSEGPDMFVDDEHMPSPSSGQTRHQVEESRRFPAQERKKLED